MNKVRDIFFPKEVEIKREGHLRKLKQVACGSDHTLAIDMMGFLYSAGDNRYG